MYTLQKDHWRVLQSVRFFHANKVDIERRSHTSPALTDTARWSEVSVDT